MGFTILFHLYGFGYLDKFVFANFNFFNLQGQVLSGLSLILLSLVLSSKDPRRALGIALLAVGLVVVFVYYYYGVATLTSKWYRESSVLQSRFLVLNWEYYLFSLFFLG